MCGHFIDPIPAQMRMGKSCYEGTADAIEQGYVDLNEVFLFEQLGFCFDLSALPINPIVNFSRDR